MNDKTFSKKQIERCGKMIINEQDLDSAINILSEYRKLHISPLNKIYKFLKKRVDKIFSSGDKVYVSQRLKRMNAIIGKLKRNPNMNFSRMQDIGGCRAIVPSIKDVYELKNNIIKQKSIFNPPHKINDYIENPKNSGYRGIHLVYKYKVNNEKEISLDGLQIEVQIRTLLQHYWSTAVETVGIFTGESLKSSQGNKDWLDFFTLVSQAFAIMEKTTLINGALNDKNSIKEQLKVYIDKLNIIETLSGYASSLDFQKNSSQNTEYSLIILNTKERSIEQIPFTKTQFNFADGMYQLLEKKYRDDNFTQVVLLSTSLMKNLKKAYPNYFADTKEFVANLQKFIEKF